MNELGFSDYHPLTIFRGRDVLAVVWFGGGWIYQHRASLIHTVFPIVVGARAHPPADGVRPACRSTYLHFSSGTHIANSPHPYKQPCILWEPSPRPLRQQ